MQDCPPIDEDPFPSAAYADGYGGDDESFATSPMGFISPMGSANPVRASLRRGRGAVSNASGRHEPLSRQAVEDGWAEDEADLAPLATHITLEKARRIITKNSSPDIPFDRSINPYRGCEHGCIYCYARPSHANMGLSPGLDFETRLFAKPDAANLLRAELAHPRYRCAPIAIGTNTDPYQPIERDQKLMRSILEILDETSHPVTIVTKSALILRDIELLSSLAQRNLVKVALSVTTLDHRLARRMEPRASTPGRRIEAMKALAEAGVPVGVMVAPVIPALTDHEGEKILAAAYAAGAREAGWVMLRLPHEIKDLFAEWLQEERPDRASRVLNLVRDMRGGRLNDARFGHRMRGEGAYAEMVTARLRLAITKIGYNREIRKLDCSLFTPPPKASAKGDRGSNGGDAGDRLQYSLFGDG
ncbi:putative protein [alpha proteobacterium Q-1]|nr:putative protein [alpha proteobacterium Q-1]